MGRVKKSVVMTLMLVFMLGAGCVPMTGLLESRLELIY